MSKKINLGTLKSEDNKFYTEKKITVNGHDILVQEHFRPSTIQRMLMELVEKVEYMKENNIKLSFVPSYILILLVKYFTNIEVPEEFEKQIQMLDLLIDNNYLEPIINAIPQEEINKFDTFVMRAKEQFAQIKDNPELLSGLLTLSKVDLNG
jgi:hypothetical protein